MKIGIHFSDGAMDSDSRRNDGSEKQSSNCWKFSRTGAVWAVAYGLPSPRDGRLNNVVVRAGFIHKEATGAFGDYRRIANEACHHD